MKKCWNKICRFVKQEEAPTMAEYGLLLVVIALIVVVGAGVLGVNLNTLFDNAATSITTPTAS